MSVLPRPVAAVLLLGISLACPPALAQNAARHSEAERALREAEAKLAPIPPLPAEMKAASVPTHCTFEHAEEAFLDVLAHHPPTARAYVGLGRCRLRLGKHEEAASASKQALELSPADRAATEGAREATQLARVARAAAPVLSRGHTLIHVRRADVEPGRTLWLVLYARRVKESWELGQGHLSEPHLAALEEGATGLRRVWQSDTLGLSCSDWWDDLQLYVADLTGDGAPETLVCALHEGGSLEPTHVDIFAWGAGRLVSILDMESSLPAEVRDIDRDGVYEVADAHHIGYTMPTCDAPVWTNIYAYIHGTYAIANAAFPEQFADLDQKLQGILQQYPDDGEILEYLGVLCEIQGRPKEALSAYRRSERAYEAALDAEAAEIPLVARLTHSKRPDYRLVGRLERVQAWRRNLERTALRTSLVYALPPAFIIVCVGIALLVRARRRRAARYSVP